MHSQSSTPWEANNASFIGLLEGKVFTTATGPFSTTFQITYEGNGGTDIVLTALDTANPVLRGTPSNDAFVVKPVWK